MKMTRHGSASRTGVDVCATAAAARSLCAASAWLLIVFVASSAAGCADAFVPPLPP
eukprot:CAMPEP_0185808760 /NCGR_PEP_ID=MMETSP1322-20130828/5803_1 /TAXON_ID=265543 /ORGANISM="Minutocellus polymorphus, Strain RCC2270" /LENGTH=55 /DNA_ID=CAMNT_0028504997 /DNA_START=15 /DNA_END=179 /DNA_ORIENTATION=+